MLCDICHDKQAVIHLKQIRNNEDVRINLCEDCANKKGFNLLTIEELPLEGPHFDLADLLSGFTDMPASLKDNKDTVKCLNCGTTYSDFKNSGRLGCSECYNAFSKQLAPLLRRLQGASYHGGKVPDKKDKPEKTSRKKTLQELKDELKKAVEQEEYEKAAIIRDKIKEYK
jgi:protein arginine kinase activator